MLRPSVLAMEWMSTLGVEGGEVHEDGDEMILDANEEYDDDDGMQVNMTSKCEYDTPLGITRFLLLFRTISEDLASYRSGKCARSLSLRLRRTDSNPRLIHLKPTKHSSINACQTQRYV